MRPFFMERKMTSIDKVQRGIARYLDTELVPKMQGKDKWLITGAATLYLARLPEILNTLNTKPAFKILGLISDDGNIDLDAVVNSVRPAARQTPIVFNIPFGGALTFTENDLDIIVRYINQT